MQRYVYALQPTFYSSFTDLILVKVGGLPLPELNHLELQFLILNDFRLAVPLEEMEAYGTMLVEFYAREVLAQQQSSHISRTLPHSADS
jgi:PHO85 cyclin-6/7